jgi:hypothetical protein
LDLFADAAGWCLIVFLCFHLCLVISHCQVCYNSENDLTL